MRTDTFGEKNESSVVLGCLAARLTFAGKSLVDLRLVRVLLDGIEGVFAMDFVILNKYSTVVSVTLPDKMRGS